ncbi:MAG: CAP domain-containing protein [Bacteroidales bacterium]|nr:CAP domain-containing protein [Bacteroidales bacterium]
MKKILIFLMLALSLDALAQDRRFPEWTAAEVKKANTCSGIADMSSTEREIVYLMNLARMDGAKFWNTYATKALNGASGGYISSLKNDLMRVSNLPMLYPDAGLCKAAKYHASDMARNGFFDHDSYDGTGCFDRVRRFYNSGAMAENISAGKNTAIGVVMQLLVDDGTPSLGHRKNILNSNYRAVGVSCGSHPSYQYCCVQDFGDRVIKAMGGGISDNGNNGNKGGNGGNGGNGGGKLKPNKIDSDNYNPNHHDNGVRHPKFPDISNIQDDERWSWDDDSSVWYLEQDPYVFIYEVADGLKIYYNSDTDKIYLWDGKGWKLMKQD